VFAKPLSGRDARCPLYRQERTSSPLTRIPLTNAKDYLVAIVGSGLGCPSASRGAGNQAPDSHLETDIARFCSGMRVDAAGMLGAHGLRCVDRKNRKPSAGPEPAWSCLDLIPI